MNIRVRQAGKARTLLLLIAVAAMIVAFAAARAGLVASASGDTQPAEGKVSLELVKIPDKIIEEIDKDFKANSTTKLNKHLTAADAAGLSYQLQGSDIVIEAADVKSAKLSYNGSAYELETVLNDTGAAKNAAFNKADTVKLICDYRPDTAYKANVVLIDSPTGSSSAAAKKLSSNSVVYPKSGYSIVTYPKNTSPQFTLAVKDSDKTAAVLGYIGPFAATTDTAPDPTERGDYNPLVIPSSDVPESSGDAAPAEKTFTVVSIDKDAFCGSGMTSVTIPATVKKIGDRAFSDCRSLAFVNYSGKTKPTLGDKVFYNDPCALDTKVLSLPANTLKEDTLDGDKTGKVSSSRFAGGKLLITPWDKEPYEVTIPESCQAEMTVKPGAKDKDKTYVYQVSFKDSDKRDYKIDFRLKKDGDEWLCDTVYNDTSSSWLHAYGEPDGTGVYPDFYRTSVLPSNGFSEESDDQFSYAIKDGKAEIRKYKGNGGDVVIPAEYDGKPVTAVRDSAFKDNKNVTSVTFADDEHSKSCCVAIYPDAFSGCENLSEVSLPESLRYIGEGAFKGCSLDEVTVPPYVSTIGVDKDKKKYAFDDGTTLKSAKGSAAESYCKDNSKIKFEKTSGNDVVVPVPVKYDAAFLKGEVTITVRDPKEKKAAYTYTCPHTNDTGCVLYIDNSKLKNDTEYEADITRKGFTSYTVTKYSKGKSAPSDIELYPGDFNGDNNVDIADVAELVKVYGTDNTGEVDLNEDGTIDIIDVGKLKNGYTKSSKTGNAVSGADRG